MPLYGHKRKRAGNAGGCRTTLAFLCTPLYAQMCLYHPDLLSQTTPGQHRKEAKMSTFTDQSVKSATTGDHRIPDCQALLLRVTANGAKSFRMVYRSKITGKVETK